MGHFRPKRIVTPRAASRALILGSARAALISLLGLSTISVGVFLGTPIPCQPLASKFGTNSLKVGTSGNASERVAVVTASARNANPNVLDRARQRAEVDLHLPAKKAGERWRLAPIGYMDHVDAGRHLEQFAGEMWRAPVADRRHVDLARIDPSCAVPECRGI